MSNGTTLCAVVCTYNRYELLGSAIDSLLHQEGMNGDYSIQIVDNSPDANVARDEAAKYRNNEILSCVYVDRPGLSNARNVAARGTDADIIAYLDDDAIASPGWARSLVDAFDRFPEAAIAGGPVLPIWEIERPPWLSDRLSSYVSVVNWGGDSTRLAEHQEWFAGANIAFRRGPLLDAGGFDTSLGRNGGGASLLSNEETKLTEKLRETGFQAVYAPSASVRHLVERGRMNQTWFRRRVVWQAVSDYMASGGKTPEELQTSWNWSLTYMSQLPPADRTFRGLFRPSDAPNDFEGQLSALYGFTLQMLAGFPSTVTNP